jgi:transcriptional regulator GlxA family with amidase domain
VQSPVHQLNQQCEAAASGALRRSLVGIVVFNGFALHEMARFVEAFELANTHAQADQCATPYQIVLLSASGGRIASESSLFVWTERAGAYAKTTDFHAVFVVNGPGLQAALRDIRLADWFAMAYPHGERLPASAYGRQRLTDAGLYVTGCEAPAPSHASAEQQLFGAALRLIETDLGESVAARIACSRPRPAESPSPALASHSPLSSISEKIQASIRWLETNSDKPVVIRDLAQAAAMSERNFLRHFKVETGLTPSEYLVRARIGAVCDLLVQTELSVEKIAYRCGVGNGVRLARLFRSRLGVTPTEYRHSHLARAHPHSRAQAELPKAAL